MQAAESPQNPARFIKQAQLPQPKTLESFDWEFNLKLPKAVILDLATLRFIPERGGALILGAAGLGKSHLCISIAVRAIEAGYPVPYRSAFDLAEDLAEAAATGTRKELIARLSWVDLLVLEDLGGRRLPVTAGEDLLEVFSRRYESGATILTSNRPLEDFGEVLGDNVAAGVLLGWNRVAAPSGSSTKSTEPFIAAQLLPETWALFCDQASGSSSTPALGTCSRGRDGRVYYTDSEHVASTRSLSGCATGRRIRPRSSAPPRTTRRA
ncbi:MAG: ATP-binding protein [Candidatus Dormibacteraeota bacterium]|uniref:ATP-binding protein n=1 Tax=Candidatus Dormiibacter inghamiae TaxID=3127013 RepID=A0A934KDI2_9BACT|nr:ATP-binding protein [Candidatus Dormibacteraeota bacterium]MBJ7607765.1 ATP-binding protein [Candidatus Dormibacteraeota bacterium]